MPLRIPAWPGELGDGIEAVRPHLADGLLTVEGRGSTAGRVVHRAFAVISSDDQHAGWRWTAYVPGGRTDTDLTIYPDGFGWTLHDAGPARPASEPSSPGTAGRRPVDTSAATADGRRSSRWTCTG